MRFGGAAGIYFLCSVFPSPSGENSSLSAVPVGRHRQEGRGRGRHSDKLSPELKKTQTEVKKEQI